MTAHQKRRVTMRTTETLHTDTMLVFGYRIHVAVRPGRPHAVPLVICNGIGAHLEAFDPLVDELDPARTVIRFDVPGSGTSPTPLRPYRFGQLAALVTRMVSALGYQRFDVLGYSWGGALAQQLALQNPRRVRRVVLASTSPGMGSIPGHPLVLSKMLTRRRHHDPAYAIRVAPGLYGGSVRNDAGSARAILGTGTPHCDTRGYLYQLFAGVGWNSLPWLPLICQPTLLLYGNDDPIIPVTNGRIMNMLLRRAELQIFTGGHLDLLVCPAEFAQRIDRFLGGIPPASSRAKGN